MPLISDSNEANRQPTAAVYQALPSIYQATSVALKAEVECSCSTEAKALLFVQVKEKLLAMAQDSCQRSLADMHSRAAKLALHPSTLSDFCTYMVRCCLVLHILCGAAGLCTQASCKPAHCMASSHSFPVPPALLVSLVQPTLQHTLQRASGPLLATMHSVTGAADLNAQREQRVRRQCTRSRWPPSATCCKTPVRWTTCTTCCSCTRRS